METVFTKLSNNKDTRNVDINTIIQSMIKKLLTLPLLLWMVMACDSNENEQTSLPDDTSEELPEIPIVGFEANLEVATTLNISIPENSNIERTSVLVNEDELLSTTNKTFSFDLNPFDYPTGQNTLSLVFSDTDGNESRQSKTFEVNKLLVSIASARVFSSRQAFFSVNTLQGELIAFANVTKEVENINLYANDGFVEQPIVVTSYIINSGEFYQVDVHSISDLEPGTDLIALQRAAGITTEDTFDGSPLITPFTIDVFDLDTEEQGESLFAVGHNHIVEANSTTPGTGGFTSQLRFISNNEPIRDVVLYTSQSGTVAVDNQFNIEDYRYRLIPNPTDQSLSFTEFETASNTVTFNIPDNTENYTFRVFGFLNQTALANNEYRYVYDSNSGNTSSQIQFPVIPEYTILRNDLRISLNGGNTSFKASTLGEKDIALPNWSASLSGDVIALSGDFDKFTTSFSRSSTGGVFNWKYTTEQKENFELPFDDFELPSELLTFATANNLDLSAINSTENFRIALFDSSKEVTYAELLFHPFTYHLLDDVYELSFGL